MKTRSDLRKKALIIVNPVSGRGDQRQRRQVIRDTAREFGWHGEIIETTTRRTASEIATTAIADGQKMIIVCGGDGTVMEVVGAAVRRNVTIGVVPLGTGNLLARNLLLPLDTKNAVRVVFNGQEKSIDIGKANDIYFSILAGIGLDAEMMRGADRELKNKYGIGAYLVSMVRALRQPSGLYQVCIDGNVKRLFSAKAILVANMAELPGGVEVVPVANPDSGKLKIGIIKAETLFSWGNLVMSALQGNINKSPHYTLLKGKTVDIVSLEGPKPFECDGNEFSPVEKLQINIYPQSLRIIVPGKL